MPKPISEELLTLVMQSHGKQAHEYHAQQVYLRRYYNYPTTHTGPSWRLCTAMACRDAVALHARVFREVGPTFTRNPYHGYVAWQRTLRKIQLGVEVKP